MTRGSADCFCGQILYTVAALGAPAGSYSFKGGLPLGAESAAGPIAFRKQPAIPSQIRRKGALPVQIRGIRCGGSRDLRIS